MILEFFAHAAAALLLVALCILSLLYMLLCFLAAVWTVLILINIVLDALLSMVRAIKGK